MRAREAPRVKVVAVVTAVLIALLVIPTISRTAYSQPPPEGTLIGDLFVGSNVGLGIGFDGQYLYWLDISGTTLHKITTTGTFVADIPINGCTATVISFDATRGKFWGADGTQISLIDPTTGNCTPMFDVGNVCQGCNPLVDGINYDVSDDSIWYSPDGSIIVYHFDTNGNFLGSFRIDTPPNDMFPECGFNYNSGIAVGAINVMYLAADGCQYIFKYDKSGNKLGSFVIPAFRHEDMECDNVTFADQGVDAIWIKDAFDGHIRAFAVEKGTCAFGGGELTYNLELYEDGNPSDGVINLGEDITAKATTNDSRVVNVTFRWIDPSNNEVRNTTVNIVSGEASDTFTPNQVGTWKVVAEFSDGTIVVKELQVPFQVVPESIIGALSVIGSSLAVLAVYRRKRSI
jgi:hypothetical protein